MRMATIATAVIIAAPLVMLGPAAAQTPAPADVPTISTPHLSAREAEALQVQVTLDRSGFSPGVIDGRRGTNTAKALELFQQSTPTAPPVAPLTTYTITEADITGPFVDEIPSDLVEQSKLPALSYTSAVEQLAERFHTTPAFLRRLNPAATFAAGEQIAVPNVDPLVAPVEKIAFTAEMMAKAPRPAGTSGPSAKSDAAGAAQVNLIAQRPDVTVMVSKSKSGLSVTDAAGKVIFYAPVTTGSENDPLPIGEWKVNGIQFNPTFNYNPDLFWDADPAHTKAKIPSGPNNPVGFVWIDLSKPHYGIHGTPEPSTIGRTQSHGCVRLTNWDVIRLAGMVKPGTKVVFTE
jgi:lipoprotein-anchoring transpeptidase ErfK/SrfK